jgi:hypothetical protein
MAWCLTEHKDNENWETFIMRSFRVVPISNYYTLRVMSSRKNTRGTHEADKKWIPNFGRNILMDNVTLNLRASGKIILKCFLNKHVWEWWLDSTGWDLDLILGSCEQGNEPSGSIRRGNVLINRVTTSFSRTNPFRRHRPISSGVLAFSVADNWGWQITFSHCRVLPHAADQSPPWKPISRTSPPPQN